jgi:DNA-binding SARP family transcriptional activator
LHKKTLSLSIFYNLFDRRLWLPPGFLKRQGVIIVESKSIQPRGSNVGPVGQTLLLLRLFGQMQVHDGCGRDILPRSRKTRAVLAVLALAAPKPVLRSRLTELLWSRRAREQARGSLRQAVHELQRSLGEAAGVMLQADRNHLSLSDDGLWVDVRVLAGATVADAAPLELFRPTLLDDLDGLDPAFDGWLTDQRQRAAQVALVLAETALASANEIDLRIAVAERLLTIERAHERAWQTLIRAYLEQGNQAAARLAFERCLTSLSSAGFSPSRETEALFHSTSHAPTGATSHVARKAIRLCVLPPRVLDRSVTDDLLPGLAEEITLAVSRFRWIACFVETPQQSAADYVLDSTLQRSGNRMRVIVRLLDISAGNDIIWARRFDREVDDVLQLQGELASEISAQIDPELLLGEGERRAAGDSRGMSAFDLTLRAIPAIYRLEPIGFHAAGELLSAAAAMEPGNAAAHAWWAYWHLFLVGQAWGKDPADATIRAGALAERAVTLDPGDARALALVGHVRGFLYKHAEEACTLHERALSLNPYLPFAWCFSGLAHIATLVVMKQRSSILRVPITYLHMIRTRSSLTWL